MAARADADAPPRGSAALLNHLTRLAHARSEAALEREGLRPRHVLALTLLRDHGGFSQQGFATALQMDKTNLVGLLNELESDGLVTRRRAAEDRRRHVVELTPAGKRKLGKAEEALSSVDDAVLAGLTVKERHALHRLLQRATEGHVRDCTKARRAWATGTPD